MSSIIKLLKKLNVPKANLWINEANFGFQYIQHYCENLSPNSQILEVGCGSGILLSILSERFTQLDFEGIEPFGSGFSSLQELNKIIKSSGIKIHNLGFEDYTDNREYDLIYCINVFEHLNDWKHFLNWCNSRLVKGGKLVILCPNYSFPYESHFSLPILINPKFTYTLFNNQIREYESRNSAEGLWDSINFVKKYEVIAHIKSNSDQLDMTIFDDLRIIDDLLLRGIIDPEFRARQRFLTILAKSIFFLRLNKIIKLFPKYLPYMKLELVRGIRDGSPN